MHEIITSNHLESLCETLAGNISNPGNGVFGKSTIITQSTGMNAWLKTGLARHNRIFANFEFQNQDGFFSGIYHLLFTDKLQKNIDEIKYKIYKCLDIEQDNDRFPEISGYYRGNELRRFQLAGKLADLFDQYQLYRPEMVEKWDRGKLSTENPAEVWQQRLWGLIGVTTKLAIKQKIVSGLETNGELIKKTYPEISLFGITMYTRFHLDFFMELSRYTKVNFYLCLPANTHEFRNELLAGFGTKALELAEMFSFPGFTPELNDNGNLLAGIQNQVALNGTETAGNPDDSVQVNSCYTPAREAECLYNYLLDLFEKDKNLLPGDVLVMATDIGKYAPFIRAVFQNAEVKIPFQISGAPNNSGDTIIAALEQVLSFREDDLTSEKVVSLLEQKRIKQRFRVADTDYIRAVIRKANIRFGRENRIEDDTRFVSWSYGLEKILLGYAMLTEEEYPVGEGLTLFPYRDAEASASHDLFRLKAFVETLESVIDAQVQSKTPADWKSFLFEEVIGKMIFWDDFSKDDRTEVSSIYRSLSLIDNLEMSAEVPFAIFLEELKSKLFTESMQSRLNTGRVTVSSPIPVRGLPFKVICFIGLDNGVFPRKDHYMGFDLLGEEYRLGDRSKKEADKYLFLDTILAAREKLYLSYIGQSVKDNSGIPPSIVVDTLLDYIGSDSIVVEHPLHGFSSHYQTDDTRLFTYLYSAATTDYTTRAREERTVSEVSIGSLVKFFQAPIDWYFNNVLGIKYDDTESCLSETEIFDLDYLQKWKIEHDLMKLPEDQIEHYVMKGKKEGFLPLGSGAVVAVDTILEEIDYVKPEYLKLTGNRLQESIIIDTIIDGIRISGTIENVFDKDYIVFSLSKNPAKYKIEAYVKALLLYSENKIDSAVFMDRQGITSEMQETGESARARLAELLHYFRQGYNVPLLYTLKAAEKLLEYTAKGKDSDTTRQAILDVFEGEAFPDESNPYPANLYLRALINENRLANFGDAEIQKISEMAQLLNINPS